VPAAAPSPSLGDTPAAGMAQEPPAAPPVATVLVSTQEVGGSPVPPATPAPAPSSTTGRQPPATEAGSPVAQPLPPGCRPAPCDMHIPGYNDAHHTATVYVCDQLPPEVASQPMSQATGTCNAAWQSRWLPPAVAWSASRRRSGSSTSGAAAGSAGDE
jgi:hypothetical protein